MKNHKIKVANVIEEGRLGGPQFRIIETTRVIDQLNEKDREKDEQKHHITEVTVIYPENNSEYFRQRLQDHGIKNIRIPLHRLTRNIKGLLLYVLLWPYEIFVLWCLLKKENFDVVHVSGGAWQFKGVIAGRLARCKVLWHLNDTYMPAIIHMYFRWIAGWGADGFIVSCEKVKKVYLDHHKYNKPIFKIYPPVNTEHFKPQKNNLKKNDLITVTTLANVNPLKGLENFIEVAQKLKKYNNVIFQVVGAIYETQKKYYLKLMESIQRMKLQNVKFHGYCHDPQKVLLNTDIYVCSSLAESGPMSLFEAMSMTIPVVTTDVGDVSNFIINGENGFVVPIKDSAGIAEKVRSFIENTSLRKKCGENARKTTKKYLDVKIAARAYRQAYLKIAERL